MPLRGQAWVRHALLALDGSRCERPGHNRGKVARAQSVREVSWSGNGGPSPLENQLAAAKDRFRETPSEATLAELLRAAGSKKAFITNCTVVQGHWQVNLLRGGGNNAPVADPARLLLGLYTGNLGRALDMEITSAPVAIIAANGTVKTRVGLRWGAQSDEVTLHSHIIARQNQLEQAQQTAHSAALNFKFPFTPPRKLDVVFRDSDLLIVQDEWGAISALWRLPTDTTPVKRKPRLQGRTSTAVKLGKSVAPSAPNVRYPGLELRLDKLEQVAELGRLRTKAVLNAANADVRHLEERVQEECQGIAQRLTSLEKRGGDNQGEMQELGRALEELQRSFAVLEEAHRSSSALLEEVLQGERMQTDRRLRELEERVAASSQNISNLCLQSHNFSSRLSELEDLGDLEDDDDLEDLKDLVGHLEARIKDLEEISNPLKNKRFQDLETQLLEMKTNNERIKASQENMADRVFSDLHQLRSQLDGVETRIASAQEGMQLLISRVEDIDRRDLAPKGWVEQRLGEFWRQLRTRLELDKAAERTVNLARRLSGDRQGITDQDVKKRVEQQGKAIADLKKRLDTIDKLLFSL